jgi:CheY-like chemotaxis protein
MYRRRAGDRDGGGEHELIVAAVDAGGGGVAQVLSAIAQLLWPLVALILAYWLLPELKQIFRRISESKNLKVKWGDKELSIQEAADNLQKVVGSLMDAEAARASGQPAGAAPFTSTSPATRTSSETKSMLPSDRQLNDRARTELSSRRRILWVDDKPEGNAFEMARLKERGIQIDEALSTEEALRLFEPDKYSLVVTDMYRKELGIKNADAGIDLLKELGTMDPSVVVICYCATISKRQYGSSFLKSGGRAITSSSVELFELLGQYLPQD